MSKIMCVDDDEYLADLLRYALIREGHSVQLVHRGHDAIQLAKIDAPDLILLDVNLPDVDGLTLCTRFRSQMKIPVIMLTPRQSDEDMIAGFSQGADDCIGKPFNIQVLGYRIRAVLRRVRPESISFEGANTTYRLGDGLFSTKYNEIIVNQQRFQMTRTEGKILHLLLAHEGQVLSAERIMERIWGYDTESSVTVIKTHIRHLRTKIADAIGPQEVIHTVAGMGYTLRQKPATQAASPVAVSHFETLAQREVAR